MKSIRFIVISFLSALLAIFSPIAPQLANAADEQAPPGIEKQGRIPGKGKHKGWEKGKHKGWEKAKEGEKKEKAEKKPRETKDKGAKSEEKIKKTTEEKSERGSSRIDSRRSGAVRTEGGRGRK